MSIPQVQAFFGPDALAFWRGVTVLGDGTVVFAVFCALAWVSSTERAVRIGVLGILAGLVVGYLKIAIQDPRPFLVDSSVVPWEPSAGFGMPSGHAATAAALFLPLWIRHRTTAVLLLVLSSIALVGLSRIYLGVHTGAQVLAGWAVGAAVVAGAVVLEKPLRRTLSRLGLLAHVALASVTCAILAFAQYAATERFSEGFEVPTAWVERTLHARAFIGEPPASPADVTVATFFEPHRAYLALLLLGMWLVCVGNGRGWSPGPLDTRTRVSNIALGVPALLAMLMAILGARNLPWLAASLVVSVPLVVAVCIPWISSTVRLHRERAGSASDGESGSDASG